MSNKLNKNEVVVILNGLAQDCAAWENGAYKASNTELYALLDRCFTLLEQMKGQTKLISELNDLLTEKGIVFNDGTSLATKVALLSEGGKVAGEALKVQAADALRDQQRNAREEVREKLAA